MCKSGLKLNGLTKLKCKRDGSERREGSSGSETAVDGWIRVAEAVMAFGVGSAWLFRWSGQTSLGLVAWPEL